VSPDSDAGSRAGYRTLRLCSGGGGFEAIRLSEGRLDLPTIRRKLEAGGIPTVDARVMLIATLEAEVTISVAGRVLIKTADPSLAARVFDRVHPFLSAEPDPARPGRSLSRSG